MKTGKPLEAIFDADRNMTICREREIIEHDLTRIMRTKLVMKHDSLVISEELDSDIEGMAAAFAKLMADKKLVNDGIRRLGAMLKAVQKQIQREPACARNADIFQPVWGSYQERLMALRYACHDLNLVESNYQSAIEVVQSKIQVINSRTNIETQAQIKDLLKVNIYM